MKTQQGDFFETAIAIIIAAALVTSAFIFADLIRVVLPAAGRLAIPIDYLEVTVKGAISSVGLGALVD